MPGRQEALGICYNSGEGGLHEDFYRYGANTVVQVASGRFGVHKEYLKAGAAIEIKGPGSQARHRRAPAGAKIVGDVSRTRMVPEGSDAISPAPHHDIYSIEDLRQLVCSLKEATEYRKPVIVKVAAVHNIAAIASGIARSGADIIAIDGFRGGTRRGAHPYSRPCGDSCRTGAGGGGPTAEGRGASATRFLSWPGAASAAPRTSSRRWPWERTPVMWQQPALLALGCPSVPHLPERPV